MRVVWLLVLAGLATGAEPSAPAPPSSERAESRLPSWLTVGAEERFRINGLGGIDYASDAADLYVLQRLRVNLVVTPASWLRFTFQGQDSRAAGQDPQLSPLLAKDPMDLRWAYVELGDAERRPFTVRLGRQGLGFGDGRLVADSRWGNLGRSYDGVRVTARRGGLVFDAFATAVVRARPGAFNRSFQGDNLHGLHASMREMIPRATLEGYVFWRLAPGVIAESGAPGRLNVKTMGVRWAGAVFASCDYNVEMVLQRGRHSTDRISAWAGHWVFGRTFDAPHSPRVFGEYNYGSGDRDPNDGRHGAFNQLMSNSHDKFGLADQFMWSNLHHGRTGLEMKLRRSLTLSTSYHSFWLASARDAQYAPGLKPVARSIDGRAGRRAAQELDVEAFWAPWKNAEWNWGVGRIFPGPFLRATTEGAPQYYVFANLVQRF